MLQLELCWYIHARITKGSEGFPLAKCMRLCDRVPHDDLCLGRANLYAQQHVAVHVVRMKLG